MKDCQFWSYNSVGIVFPTRWYRGQVLTAHKYQLEVFFLDYGDTEWVPSNMVQPIDPSLLIVSVMVIRRSTVYSLCYYGSSFDYEDLLM